MTKPVLPPQEVAIALFMRRIEEAHHAPDPRTFPRRRDALRMSVGQYILAYYKANSPENAWDVGYQLGFPWQYTHLTLCPFTTRS